MELRSCPPEESQQRIDTAQGKLDADADDSQAARDLEVAQQTMANAHFYEECRHFSRMVSEHNKKYKDGEYVITTGGGPGIMEAANRGAYEVESPSIGLNIILPFEQVPNPYITPGLCFQFNYFAVRKMHFLLRAKALVCFLVDSDTGRVVHVADSQTNGADAGNSNHSLWLRILEEHYQFQVPGR